MLLTFSHTLSSSYSFEGPTLTRAKNPKIILAIFQVSISGKDHSGFPTRVKVGPSNEYEVDTIFDIIADTACAVGRRQGAASQTAVKVTAPDGTTIVIF